MKWIVLTLVFIITPILAYFMGYYHATNDVVFFLSVNQAATKIATISKIQEQEYEQASELNHIGLETDIAAIKDISNLRGNFCKIPKRVASYHSTFSVDSAFVEERQALVMREYAELKEYLAKKDTK